MSLGRVGPATRTTSSEGCHSHNCGSNGQVLNDGTVWYVDDFVFASEENWLTFWNTNTGYGAFINAGAYYPFGPN